MEHETNLSWIKELQLLDRTEQFMDKALNSFALDELLCGTAFQTGHSFCHIWRSSGAFILGHKDSRLPNVSQAVKTIEQKGYDVFVRNSGGAAVPLDVDVVNVSLIFPKVENRTLYDEFEKMYQFIAKILESTQCKVEKGEIKGAYCPGDYDLSIAGKKFCGIAQRRKLNAHIVQAFIVTGGSGAKRAELVREFYDLAAIGSLSVDYPQVESSYTGSLEELTSLGHTATLSFIQEVHRLLDTKQNHDCLVNQYQIDQLAYELRYKYPIIKNN